MLLDQSKVANELQLSSIESQLAQQQSELANDFAVREEHLKQQLRQKQKELDAKANQL